MKNIKQYLMAGMAILMLTACPSDPESETQSYTQNIVLPSNASEQEVTLTQLHSSISNVQNPVSWLTVEIQSYSSGSPKFKLRSASNTERTERKCNVIITAYSGDKVTLSVTQQGVAEGTGIDDLHDSQTDKPAYRRQ
ncbi:MAG: BACON domain-containing protein [Bacteroidaceae bacterium]|nr:BACON domain-containing protein [Bacteroidaceae bacterium]